MRWSFLTTLFVVVVFGGCNHNEDAVTGAEQALVIDAGRIHNEVLLRLDEKVGLDGYPGDVIDPAILVAVTMETFDSEGLRVEESEVRRLFQAAMDFVLEVESELGVNLRDPQNLSREDIDAVLSFLATQYGIDVPAPAPTGTGVIFPKHDPHKNAAQDIYEHSVQFWQKKLGGEGGFGEAYNCANDPRCDYIISSGVVDLAGGLFGSLFGPLGTMVGSIGLSTAFKLDYNCCTFVNGCQC